MFDKIHEITIQGKTMSIVFGHTKAEWEKERCIKKDSGDVWDFSVEDIISGAIEVDEDVIYWYIDGRFYEGDIILLSTHTIIQFSSIWINFLFM